MRKVLKWLTATFLFLFVLLLALVAPIDDTPLAHQPFYSRMMEKLDTFQLASFPASEAIAVGWSQFSIVPDYPLPMAGYKPRDHFTDVHDSVFIKVMAIDNGGITAYLISADLLIFPPMLKDMILSNLPSSGKEFIYFSATHTHTSIGSWDPSLLGNILMGEYDEDWVETMADNTIAHMAVAKASLLPAKIGYWDVDVREYVGNRIESDAPVDGMLRGLSVMRRDSSKALLYALGAHPTLISKNFTSLSADYPGEIAKRLSGEFDFTQFMAGTVGSQRFVGFNTTYDFQLTSMVGDLFASTILNTTSTEHTENIEIKTGKIKLEQGASQLRLLKDVKLRDWVFSAVSRPLNAELTILQIGNILMIGTSCDFSGELAVVQQLEAFAKKNNLRLIITSFNGDYTGYITEDSHYNTSDDEEVMALNWVGPYYGQYYAETIKRVIQKSSQ
ncbi:MAG: hypothetical protein ABJH04_10925 [Cyclobacteriaceae bacterium]